MTSDFTGPGLLGAVIDVRWSLTLSAAALVVVVIGLFIRDRRSVGVAGSPATPF